MAENWTEAEYRAFLTKKKIGKRDQNRAVKDLNIRNAQSEFKEYVDSVRPSASLFDEGEAVEEKPMREITLYLSGTPMPKQSYKSGVTRHRTAGFHKCPYTGKDLKHKKGDVLLYRSKHSGCVDVIPIAYVDKKFTDRTNEYKFMIQEQLPKGFIRFENEVHITKLEFIFPPLKSFSKKILNGLKDKSLLKYKDSKIDVDNLMKLVNDSMNGGVYEDDGLIVSYGSIVKRYGFKAGIVVTLRGF